MPWENNSGGPWGGNRGGGRGGNGGGNGPNSPWGRPGGGNRGGGGNGGGQPPDVEELVRKGQERLKTMVPGGMGGKGIAAVAVLAILAWLASGFYLVGPDEQGVELVFGKLTSINGPGLNYNLPSPIGEVIKPKVTVVNQVDIGFQQLPGGSIQAKPAESLMLTGDENIVEVGFSVFWKIRDAKAYLFNVRNPSESVRNASEAAMREIVGKSGFEYIRTTGRNAVGVDAEKRIQEILDSYGAGIEIVQVNPQSVEPPDEVISAFRDVQAANADRERAINEATAYFNEVTQRAEGQGQQIVRAAEAYKEERVNRAVGDTQRFLAILKEYKNAPDITKRRIYLQTMEEILQNMNKVLIENPGDGKGTGVLPYLPLDSLTKPKAKAPATNGGAQ